MHVVQRGNNRQQCFRGEGDFIFYLELLTELSARFECPVHSYALMTNHVHLLLTPSDNTSVSWLMKNLGQRFAQRVNLVYRRSGTLWEGRYHSTLVEDGDYLLSCYRYIELNPVRAGMVRDPRDYRWSSYRVNAEGRSSPLVQPHACYLSLAGTSGEREAAYRRLFGAPMDPSEVAFIRARTNAGHTIGTPHFRLDMTRRTGQRMDPLPRGRRKKLGSDPELELGSDPELW